MDMGKIFSSKPFNQIFKLFAYVLTHYRNEAITQFYQVPKNCKEYAPLNL